MTTFVVQMMNILGLTENIAENTGIGRKHAKKKIGSVVTELAENEKLFMADLGGKGLPSLAIEQEGSRGQVYLLSIPAWKVVLAGHVSFPIREIVRVRLSVKRNCQGQAFGYAFRRSPAFDLIYFQPIQY